MRTRDDHGIEVRTNRTAAAGPSGVEPPEPSARRTRGRVLAVGLAAALTVVAGVALLVDQGAGDDVVVARSVPPAAAAGPAAGPAELGLTVDVPAAVVAGTPARFTVRYTDGTGVVSGSSEDWGDAVATSSRKQGRCVPGAPASPPVAGSYPLRHTWSEPGTYTVVLGVATYTCEGGGAVAEEAARTLTVEVLPAG